MAGSVGLGGFIALLGVFLGGWLAIPFFLIGGFLVGFTLWFFRDPQRTPPENADGLLLAPADGTVMFVEPGRSEFVGEGAVQISIFLSPLNVHVNRVPASGRIAFTRYIPGDYLVAWHEKSSELNERSEIGMRHVSGMPIEFKQIAGAVARRIVFHISEGDVVQAGERYGIVKFGSRMDVIVPNGVEFFVGKGDKVVAGETVLAYVGDSS